jgi:hypothetical protein
MSFINASPWFDVQVSAPTIWDFMGTLAAPYKMPRETTEVGRRSDGRLCDYDRVLIVSHARGRKSVRRIDFTFSGAENQETVKKFFYLNGQGILPTPRTKP